MANHEIRKQDRSIYHEILDPWQDRPPWPTAAQRQPDHVAADRDPVDDIGLSSHALFILKERFLRRDERGNVVETPGGMCHRVSAALAAAETPDELDPHRARLTLEFSLATGGHTTMVVRQLLLFPTGDVA